MPSDLSTAISQPVMESLATKAVPVVGGGELLNMGLSILIVIAAILLLGWFYSKSRSLNSSGDDIINVVATRSLGPKERLMVIEVADLQVLLGMTTAGIRTLHVFDKPLAVPEPRAASPNFAARLRSSMRELRQ